MQTNRTKRSEASAYGEEKMDLMRAHDTKIKGFDLNSEYHVGRKEATEHLPSTPSISKKKCSWDRERGQEEGIKVLKKKKTSLLLSAGDLRQARRFTFQQHNNFSY